MNLRLERPLKFILGAERVSQVVKFVTHVQDSLHDTFKVTCDKFTTQEASEPGKKIKYAGLYNSEEFFT